MEQDDPLEIKNIYRNYWQLDCGTDEEMDLNYHGFMNYQYFENWNRLQRRCSRIGKELDKKLLLGHLENEKHLKQLKAELEKEELEILGEKKFERLKDKNFFRRIS